MTTRDQDQPGPRVFVSHSHADNEFCRVLVNGLRSHGLDVWYDEHNLGWGELRQVIERELMRCEHFIPILSPAAVASHWVNREIDAALVLLSEGSLHTFLPVTAARCDVPLLLRGFKRLEGPQGAPLEPAEAVARALPILGIMPALPQAHPSGSATPASSPAAPLAPSGTQKDDPYALPTFAAPWPIRLPPIPRERFPILLTGLGYEARNTRSVEVILPQTVVVPAGECRIGSDPSRDPAASEDELPRHTVHVGAFRIARYPVTVAEYACFVRAGAPEPPHSYAGLDWPAQLQRLDHPVTGVSFREAAAYAEWLSKITGQRWYLPTEEQWEKSACWDGQGARMYPWGDEFDAGRCNTAASPYRATTPVGQYPSGASPSGAEEMAGNVWEWTSSPFRPYSYDRAIEQSQPRAARSSGRVVRGGGWASPPEDARCAARACVPSPDYRDGSLGFRLALSATG